MLELKPADFSKVLPEPKTWHGQFINRSPRINTSWLVRRWHLSTLKAVDPFWIMHMVYIIIYMSISVYMSIIDPLYCNPCVNHLPTRFYMLVKHYGVPKTSHVVVMLTTGVHHPILGYDMTWPRWLLLTISTIDLAVLPVTWLYQGQNVQKLYYHNI